MFHAWTMEFKTIDFTNGISVGEDCGKYVDSFTSMHKQFLYSTNTSANLTPKTNQKSILSCRTVSISTLFFNIEKC